MPSTSGPRQILCRCAGGEGRHRDGGRRWRAALTDTRRRREHRPPGRVPDRRARSATSSNCSTTITATCAGRSRRIHGRHRLGAEHLFLMTRARRTRPRILHPHRLGRAGGGTHAPALFRQNWKNPAVTGVSVKFSDARADMTPAAISPISIAASRWFLAARLDKLAGLGRDPRAASAIGRGS